MLDLRLRICKAIELLQFFKLQSSALEIIQYKEAQCLLIKSDHKINVMDHFYRYTSKCLFSPNTSERFYFCSPVPCTPGKFAFVYQHGSSLYLSDI